MRRYETVFILDPDLGEDVRTQRYDKVNEIIDAYKGAVIEFDDWGVRKLAYEIKKKNRGHYVRLDYCGDGALVSELERTFRLDDKFLKFMTIILGDNVTPEQIMAEKEEAAAKEAAKEAEEAEKTVKTETVAPVKAETAEPVVAETAEPVVAETAEPVVAETAEPVVADAAEPVVAETTEPVVAETEAAEETTEVAVEPETKEED